MDLSTARPHSFRFREGLGTRLAHSHPRGRSLPINSTGTAATPVRQWSRFKAAQNYSKVDHKYQWSMVNSRVAVSNQGVAMHAPYKVNGQNQLGQQLNHWKEPQS